MPKTKISDPLDVNGRLYKQISLLLEQLEGKEAEAVDIEALCARIEKALALRTESLMRARVREALDAVGPRGISMRERIAALIAIGRIQIMFTNLTGDQETHADAIAGSTVRKYSAAFGAKTNVAARRGRMGRGAINELSNVFTLGDDLDIDADER